MKRFEYKFSYGKSEIDYIRENVIFDKYKEEDTIFEYIILGYTCEQIASLTGLCERTVQRRRRDLHYKINNCLMNKIDTETNNPSDDAQIPQPLHKNTNYCVYALVFPNHKMYIGQTKDTERRWRKGHGYQTNAIMYNDILKYGWDNILKIIVCRDLSYKQSVEKEKELTILYRTNEIEFGYNRIIGNGDKR